MEEEAEEEEEEIGRDDNDLGQGKVWAKLTDGAKDAGANAGGDGSLVDVMNEGGGEMETMLTDGGKKRELVDSLFLRSHFGRAPGGDFHHRGCWRQ